MKAHMKRSVVMTIMLAITPAISVAQARGPTPVIEEVPGLLSQATTSPAFARLAAFGEFPGAELVSAEIKHYEDRLVYFFDLKVEGRSGTEQVQINATTGEISCIEYTVDRDPKKHLAMTAPPELVSLVNLSFASARESANAAIEDGHVLGCKLRVDRTSRVYVFELEVGDNHVPQQACIDARTGVVLSAGQP